MNGHGGWARWCVSEEQLRPIREMNLLARDLIGIVDGYLGSASVFYQCINNYDFARGFVVRLQLESNPFGPSQSNNLFDHLPGAESEFVREIGLSVPVCHPTPNCEGGYAFVCANDSENPRAFIRFDNASTRSIMQCKHQTSAVISTVTAVDWPRTKSKPHERQYYVLLHELNAIDVFGMNLANVAKAIATTITLRFDWGLGAVVCVAALSEDEFARAWIAETTGHGYFGTALAYRVVIDVVTRRSHLARGSEQSHATFVNRAWEARRSRGCLLGNENCSCDECTIECHCNCYVTCPLKHGRVQPL
jgi:hypothetical protein